MSVRRVLRFFMGVIVAAVILAIVLPFFGVPSSHYLPPAMVYAKATGETRGWVVGKYYAETGNPFHVGMDEYFLNYVFKAPAPGPRGAPPGPMQVYKGTVRVDQNWYDQYKSANSQNEQQVPGNQVIPLPGYSTRVRYETTYPDINGVDATWALTYQNGRSIGAGSNVMSGWLIWAVAAVILGYIAAIVIAGIMKSEDL